MTDLKDFIIMLPSSVHKLKTFLSCKNPGSSAWFQSVCPRLSPKFPPPSRTQLCLPRCGIYRTSLIEPKTRLLSHAHRNFSHSLLKLHMLPTTHVAQQDRLAHDVLRQMMLSVADCCWCLDGIPFLFCCYCSHSLAREPYRQHSYYIHC